MRLGTSSLARTSSFARTSSLALTLVLASCTGEGMDDAGEDGPGVRGRLIDADGHALAGVEVLACQATTCFYGDTNDEGRFEFVIEPPADVALKTHANLASVPRMAAALVPVDIVDDAIVELGDVYVPELPEGVVLEQASEGVEVCVLGEGLELSLRSADLTPSVGEFLYDVAASRIPSEHVPAYPELGDAQVLAVYALHPFAATSASPIGVRVAVDVPNGTEVELRTLSHLDGNVAEVVTAVVENGEAVTAPGVGITRLTYLIVSM
jgi:hypothetical protein